MADGDTIAEQIADIAASKAAIAQAISAKGVTVPEGAKLADLAPLVGQISGGGSGAEDTCSIDRNTATELVIPEGTTKIGNYAFYSCSAISSITIPDGVTSIGNYAFYNCENLTSLTLPNGLETIGNYAFYGCSAISSITIPDGVTSIGNYAFYNCENLTSLTLPNGLETIGNYAFHGIDPRRAIVIPEGVKTIGDKAFQTTSSYLKMYGGELHLPSTLESIGYQAFGGFGMSSTTVKCFANGTKEKFKGLLSASGPYMGVYIVLVVICTDGVFRYEGTDESIVDDDDYVYGKVTAEKDGNAITFDIQGFGFVWDDTKDDEGFFWTAHFGEEETKVTQVEILDPGRHVVVTVADMGTSGGTPGKLTFSRRTDAGVLETAWTSGLIYH